MYRNALELFHIKYTAPIVGTVCAALCHRQIHRPRRVPPLI